jgi:hypothetical protein
VLRKIYMELVLIRKELQSSRERLEQKEKDKEKIKERWRLGLEPTSYIPSANRIEEEYLSGKITGNKAREQCGLRPIDDKAFDELVISPKYKEIP